MKQILVSGCSMSYGTGFPLEKNEPTLWPNRLATLLGAEVTNVSVPGHDNQGIFISAVSELLTKKYDLILIQLSGFDRMMLSPNMNTRLSMTNLTGTHLYKILSNMHVSQFSQDQLLLFMKVLLELNGKYEHWQRLFRVIYSLQQLKKQGYNIFIINGLFNWDSDFFTNKDSKYAKKILNYDSLPDTDIEAGLEQIQKQVKEIDLSLWINPFKNFAKLAIDRAPIDNHPGSKSHEIYTNLILNKLTSL
jgi:hypothetical protein